MNQLKELLQSLYIPHITVGNILEVLIIVFVIYKLISALRNTRAWGILKGTIFLGIFFLFAKLFSFDIITLFFQSAITICAIALVVVFQQDIKKFLEQIGNKSFKQYLLDWRSKKKTGSAPKRMTDKTIKEIVDAVFVMGKAKTGSLIVIEKDTSLDEIISTGITLNSEVSSALLINIFEKNTPLHDGAVIIKNDKIVSATCYLPLSNNSNISKSLGTRHRAGIGVTEAVDCFVIISSEETGKVSFVKDGQITRNVNAETLTAALREIQEYPLPDNIIVNPKKHLLNDNLKYKIISLCLGLFLWILGMSVLDPVSTKTIEDVPIQVINSSSITSMNKTYDFGENTTVDIVVEDKSSILDRLSASDFTATVDLSRISYVNTVDVMVDVKNNTTTIKKVRDDVIPVSLEDISYSEFPVEFEGKGEPIKGYSLKYIKITPENLVITGAESTIGKIDKVHIDVDLDNVSDGDTVECIPKVYDRNGDLIDNEKLTFNYEKVKAVVFLERTKTIPLQITVIDAEDSAGQIKDITYKPSEITIFGNQNALENVDSLTVHLPIKIDVSDGSNTKFSKVISLRDYLPESIGIAPDSEKVTISVTYEPYPSKTIEIDTNNIVIKNKNDKLDYKFESPTLSVSVIAKQEILDKLTADDFTLTIDVSGYEAGQNYESTIVVECKKKVIVSNFKANVIVEELPAEEKS